VLACVAGPPHIVRTTRNSGLAAHHSRVSLGGFFERIDFDHGTHTGEFGEVQRVFGVGRRSRGPALNGLASADEFYRCDFNGVGRPLLLVFVAYNLIRV
jgi:hypothetical protein